MILCYKLQDALYIQQPLDTYMKPQHPLQTQAKRIGRIHLEKNEIIESDYFTLLYLIKKKKKTIFS